jgi:LuxR family maltose regulon positive regulatory protein
VLAESAQEALRALNPHIIALSLGHLGETQILQGKLVEARDTFEQALAASRDFPAGSSAFWGIASVGLGTISHERNELADAERYLMEGLNQGKIWNSWECMLPGMIGLASLHAARGEWDQAHAMLADLLAIHADNALPVRPAVAWARARFHLWQGNTDAAAAWAASFHLEPVGVDKIQWMREALLVARIDLALGRTDRTKQIIETLLRGTEQAGCGHFHLETLCLQAVFQERNRRPGEALATLQSALEIAEPQGYVRLFVDGGEDIRAIFGRVRPSPLENQHLAFYTNKLLSAFEAEDGPAKQGLIEPLTKRELEVLTYIAQGLTNPEIAERLFLSPNTLKAHAQNIYSKLNVNNRVQATNKAKELGLIPG